MFIFSLILLMVVIFGGLAFFLMHLLKRNMTKATSHLQGMLKDSAGKEKEIKKMMEEAEAKHKEILNRATKEAEELKSKAAKEIEEERDKVIDEAHKQSEELIERAHKTCEVIKADLQNSINKKAMELSQKLACNVIPEEIARNMHEKWLESLLASSLDDFDRLKVPQDIHQVEIETAFNLTEEQSKQLKEKIEKHLDREIEIEEKIESRLVAGVVLKLGNLVFDGSFSDRVKELVHESS